MEVCGVLFGIAVQVDSMATVTNLAEIRKDRLHVLADMLAHARIFVPGDLALDTEWRSETHAASRGSGERKVDWLRRSATY
jgi:hypothetical protein